METINIQIECRPTTGYRAVFADVDDDTGRHVTSTWYATPEEVETHWGERGFVEIEHADMRVFELKKVLEKCERAFNNHGSAGVSLVLAERDAVRAQSDADRAGIEMDHWQEVIHANSGD